MDKVVIIFELEFEFKKLTCVQDVKIFEYVTRFMINVECVVTHFMFEYLNK